MRSIVYLVVAVAAACGSVSNTKPDASTTTDDSNPGSGALTLAQASSWVRHNGSTMIAFTIARDANLTGELTVRVTGLPAGVTAPDVPVAASASAGTLTFSATTAAALGVTTNVTVELVSGSDAIDSDAFGVFVAGVPGTLDTTFGTAGRVTFPLPDPVVAATTGNATLRGIAQYPANAAAHANKIVAVATLDTIGTAGTTFKLAVARFNADGTPDLQFGTTGYRIIDGSPANGLGAADVDIDSQGRIVVTARLIDTSNVCYVTLYRLLPTGMPDSAFTTFQQVPTGGYCGGVVSSAILGGDRIVSVSNWNQPDQSQRVTLTLSNANGTPDNTAFSGDFTVRLPNPSNTKPTMQPTRIVVDPQGRYIISGNKCDGGFNVSHTNCESVVGRITSTGVWDTTFGPNASGNQGFSGLVFGTTGSGEQYFWTLTLDSSNNIYAAGFNQGYTTGTLAKFLPNGALDTSFGTSGRVTPTLVSGATSQDLTEIALDSEGRVVAGGYANAGGPLVVVTRYSAGGILDTAFGTNGVATAPSAALEPKLGLQADGRILLGGGYPRTGGGTDLALWRFWP